MKSRSTNNDQPSTKIKYTDLDVWKEARVLAAQVYGLTRQFPSDELFALVSQLRRAVVSISSNIAEGCGRQTSADTLRFLAIARGSAYEIESQLYICFDLNYCTENQLDELLAQVRRVKMLLNGFINYHKGLAVRQASKEPKIANLTLRQVSPSGCRSTINEQLSTTNNGRI